VEGVHLQQPRNTTTQLQPAVMFRMHFGSSAYGDVDVDDEAQIPKQGFLAGEVWFVPLPTYRSRKEIREEEERANRGWGITPTPVVITIISTISIIKENYKRSRLLLYETARLNKPPFAVIRLNHIILSNDAQAFDKEICKGISSLGGSNTILKEWDGDEHKIQDQVLNDDKFKEAVGWSTSRCCFDSQSAADISMISKCEQGSSQTREKIPRHHHR
jgi:hypothetical protein